MVYLPVPQYEAFMKLYTLESACQVQLMARACRKIRICTNNIDRRTRDLKDEGSIIAFRALVRRM